MEQLMDYVKPELIIVAAVLYFLGIALKQAAFIRDKYIPITLGATGIVICGIWVTSTAQFAGIQDVLTAIFASVTQGIVVAGLSTYIHQIIKQAGKEE